MSQQHGMRGTLRLSRWIKRCATAPPFFYSIVLSFVQYYLLLVTIPLIISVLDIHSSRQQFVRGLHLCSSCRALQALALHVALQYCDDVLT
jgi:hypothetical protein